MKINSQLLNNVRNAAAIKEMIAAKLGVKDSEITEEASLIKDLGADSVDVVDLVMEIENRFGIAIPDHDVENLTTTRSLINYVNGRIGSSFINKKAG